ncbi:MAG TPA: hypothetical protein VIR16_03470 [Candidatus Limnocylindrales bacterium]
MSATTGDRTFHGTWQTTEWVGCEATFGIPNGQYPASGIWNVSLLANGHDALAQWNLSDATGHYVFGGNKVGANWTQASVGPGPSFVLENTSFYPATFTLNANGHLTAWFDYGSVAPGCTSLAYGELVH